MYDVALARHGTKFDSSVEAAAAGSSSRDGRRSRGFLDVKRQLEEDEDQRVAATPSGGSGNETDEDHAPVPGPK